MLTNTPDFAVVRSYSYQQAAVDHRSHRQTKQQSSVIVVKAEPGEEEIEGMVRWRYQ